MRVSLIAAACALAAAATPALAGSPDGRIQVKALATGVLPDGSITRVRTDAIGLPAGADTRADDNITPTAAVEYFLSPSFSIETIAGVTQHDVVGAGSLAGTRLISNANVIPATVTAKLHLNPEGPFKPYMGAGPSYFFIFGEDPDVSARALGATRVNLSEELGVAVQAGFDLRLNDRGLGLSVDAKRYFINTTASFFAGNSLVLQTAHELDPWVISGGLSYRF